MDPSSITTLRSIPSMLRLLASFMLITGSARDARKQQIPSRPGSKPQIPFFAEFLHLFFCITLSVFMAGVGRGKSCCLVPSLWHDHASAGTGPLCLGGAPHPPLLLYLLNLLLYYYYYYLSSTPGFIKAGKPRGAAAGASTALPGGSQELQAEELKPKIPFLLLGSPKCHRHDGTQPVSPRSHHLAPAAAPEEAFALGAAGRRPCGPKNAAVDAYGSPESPLRQPTKSWWG